LNYIGEEDKPVTAFDDSCVNERIMEFSCDKLDFFLTHKIMWDEIRGDVYDVKVGDGVFSVPSGHFVMIGDDYGDFDWIMIDEMFGRPLLTVSTFDMALKNWNIMPLQAQNVHDEVVYWPTTKNIIPIQSNNTVILVSEKDQHLKMQRYQIEVFTHQLD